MTNRTRSGRSHTPTFTARSLKGSSLKGKLSKLQRRARRFHRTPQSLFGANLRALRQSQQWTQQELAARAGVCQRLISMLEVGYRQPTPPVRLALAQVFSPSLGVPCERVLWVLTEKTLHQEADPLKPSPSATLTVSPSTAKQHWNKTRLALRQTYPKEPTLQVKLSLPISLVNWLESVAKANSSSTSAEGSKLIHEAYLASQQSEA